MRIQNITSGGFAHSQRIRIIYGSYNPLVEASSRSTTPLSYIFIESVVDCCVVESSYLSQLLNSGLSQLRAAMTADSAQDLNILLQFMGTDEGLLQLPAILNQAKSGDNIIDNQQWWDQLFQATGIIDDQVKDSIRDQVKNLMKPPTVASQSYSQRLKQARQDDPSQTDSPTSTQTDPAGQTTPTTSNDIQRQQQQEQTYNNYLGQQLTKLQAGREANRAEIQKLLKALEDKKKAAQTESVCNYLASTLLENDQVVNNLSLINDIMARKIGIEYRCHYMPILEAGALNRLKRAFSDTANIVANPQLLNANKSQYDSQRAGKLAVQLITRHLRTQFNSKLQAAKMTPDDIIADYQKLLSLNKLPKKVQQDPATTQQINQLVDKMKNVQQLFGRVAPDSQAEAGVQPDSLSVAGPSGVEAQEDQSQSQTTQQADPKHKFTPEQKRYGKQLLSLMIQAGQQAASNFKLGFFDDSEEYKVDDHETWIPLKLAIIDAVSLFKKGVAYDSHDLPPDIPRPSPDDYKKIANIAFRYFMNGPGFDSRYTPVYDLALVGDKQKLADKSPFYIIYRNEVNARKQAAKERKQAQLKQQRLKSGLLGWLRRK